MKIHRVLIGLTAANFMLLAFNLVQGRPGVTPAQGALPVLRGSALEIVDDQGRVRASISVLPAGPARPHPDGKIYPESVLLRLIDQNGRPSVKLGTGEEGGGLYLGGREDPTYLLLKAEGPSSFIKLSNKDGREKQINP